MFSGFLVMSEESFIDKSAKDGSTGLSLSLIYIKTVTKYTWFRNFIYINSFNHEQSKR